MRLIRRSQTLRADSFAELFPVKIALFVFTGYNDRGIIILEIYSIDKRKIRESGEKIKWPKLGQ